MNQSIVFMSVFTIVLLAGSPAATQPEPFTFAGLSLNTTIAELKQRYPRSMVNGELVYLSAQESHDSISTIGLSRTLPRRHLSITFQQSQPSGRRRYPACEQLLSILTERYGAPTNVIDAQEERARIRRFEWIRSPELLTLSCFRMPSQPLYAERLTITSDR